MTRATSDEATFALTHDLGAPIRHVLAFSTLLDEREGAELDDESRDLLAQVQRSAELAQLMLEGLNRIARLAPDQGAVAELQIKEVLAGVPVPEGFRIDFEGQGSLVTDPALLRELFAELARNAEQHGGATHMDVVVEGTAAGVALRVCDDGPGIEPDRWTNLRLPFRRGAGRASVDSLGLGLAVVDKIVQLHAGKADVRQNTDGGWELLLELCNLSADPH